MARSSSDVLDEIDFFHSIGVTSPRDIATSLGMTGEAIGKALRRNGRPELAPPFERLRRRAPHPCVECGTDVIDPRSARCRKCGHRERIRTRYGLEGTPA